MLPILQRTDNEVRASCYRAATILTPEEWAEEVYRLPGGRRFRWTFAPYTRQMFRSLFEPRNIETVFQLYSRGLKSTVILLAIGYSIDQEPRRIACLWPTNSQGEKWSKDNLCGELLDCVPSLAHLGSGGKKRTGQITMLHKVFPGGLIDIFGANAPGDMRRTKASFLYADEIDAIEETQTDEGDQLAIFSKRGDEYPDTIRVYASYPSLKDHSRINTKLQATDWNEWFVTCVVCGGEPFVMHRRQLLFDNDAPELARLECPRCKAQLTDAQRVLMAHGQGFDNWKPRHEYRGRRGFHANSLLWPHPVDPEKFPGGFLQLLAERQIAAAQSEDVKRSTRVLVNTDDAEPFDPTNENERPPEWKPIYDAREGYGYTDGTIVVPKAVRLVSAFVDMQNNRLEIEWKGWAPDEQSWGLAYTVLDGSPLDIQPGSVWHRLILELQRTFTRTDGAKLKLNMAFVDAGRWGDWAFAFYQLLRRNPVKGVTNHVILTKGVGLHGAPINPRKMATIHRNIKGIPLGTWAAKDLIYARLLLQPNTDGTFPSGYMHHPLSYGENYFQQLTAEKVEIEYNGTEEVRKYVNPEQRRNEALDCAVGNLAVFKLRTWNWEAMEKELLATIPQAATPAAVEKVAPEKKPFITNLGGSQF